MRQSKFGQSAKSAASVEENLPKAPPKPGQQELFGEDDDAQIAQMTQMKRQQKGQEE